MNGPYHCFLKTMVMIIVSRGSYHSSCVVYYIIQMYTYVYHSKVPVHSQLVTTLATANFCIVDHYNVDEEIFVGSATHEN